MYKHTNKKQLRNPLRIKGRKITTVLRCLLTFVMITALLLPSYYDMFRQALAADAPTVSDITPDSGPEAGGTTVTINGTGFFKQDKVAKIDAGYLNACAVVYGKAYCWGDGQYGTLGNNTTTDAPTPTPVYTGGVLSGKTITDISVGGNAACALADGKAYCWGSGQDLGDGSTINSNVPIAVNTSGVLNGKTITDISVGGYGTCVIADGKAYCWGSNSNGSLGNGSTTPSTLPVAVSTNGVLNGKTVTDISMSGQSVCAIADSKAYCWGQNNHGQVGNNYMNDATSPVAVDTSGVLNGKTVTNISAGGYNSCAIADSKAYCWGYNYYGQLGNNSTTESHIPVAVDTSGVLNGKTVTRISARTDALIGYGSACAIADGKAYCWGDNSTGQLGDGTTTSRKVPVAVNTGGVLNGKTITTIDGGSGLLYGYAFNCAIADETAYCWGDNGNRQLGDNTTTDKHTPAAVIESAWSNITPDTTSVKFDGIDSPVVTYVSPTEITAMTPAHATGDVDVTLQNPGSTVTTVINGFHYGVQAPSVSNVSPDSGPQSGGTSVTITGDDFTLQNKATAISSGGKSTCAIVYDAAYCWGQGGFGQLGDGGAVDRSTPVAVDTSGVLSGKKITDISAGTNTSCAIADGKAYCWGYGAYGQIGDGGTSQRNTPVAVDDTGVLAGKTVTDISTGPTTCAVADGKAYCWGYGAYGQIGDGGTSQRNNPVAVDTSGVLNGKTVTDIFATTGYTCAIADGKAYCWGANDLGQLGDGSSTQRNSPVAVNTSGVLAGKTVTAIATGGSDLSGFQYGSTCVVADGKAYCWGIGISGQLGNNSTGNSTIPVTVYAAGVLSGKTVTSITTASAGGPSGHSCAIADSQAYCWGDNAVGQLGDDTNTQRNAPAAVYTSGVLSGKSVLDVSAGGFFNTNIEHSCAVTTDFNIYCWGDNSSNQLGDGTTIDKDQPNAVSESGWSSVTPAGPTVDFDGVAATGVTYVSSTELTATTPAHAGGPVDVVVTNADTQSGTLTDGFTYSSPPDAPTNLITSPASGAVALDWDAPVNDGGSPVTDYFVEYSDDGGGSWSTFTHTPSTATNISVTGLLVNTTYTFRVSAVSAIGTGDPSATATGTPIYLTLDSASSVAIDILPSGATTMSSDSDTLTVDTNNPTGYHLSIEMSGASSNLTNGTENITPSSGTLTSPTSLLVNTWGYRVDGVGGFGSGPTVAETNVSSSGYNWAGVPASGSPQTIKNSGSPAIDDETVVWYGMNASGIKPSGVYTGTVLYTAIAN